MNLIVLFPMGREMGLVAESGPCLKANEYGYFYFKYSFSKVSPHTVNWRKLFATLSNIIYHHECCKLLCTYTCSLAHLCIKHSLTLVTLFNPCVFRYITAFVYAHFHVPSSAGSKTNRWNSRREKKWNAKKKKKKEKKRKNKKVQIHSHTFVNYF